MTWFAFHYKMAMAMVQRLVCVKMDHRCGTCILVVLQSSRCMGFLGEDN